MRKMKRRDSDEHDRCDHAHLITNIIVILVSKLLLYRTPAILEITIFFSWLYIFSFVVVLNSHEAIVNAYFKQSEIFAGRVPLWIELQINPELRGKSTSCNQNHQFQCAVTLF